MVEPGGEFRRRPPFAHPGAEDHQRVGRSGIATATPLPTLLEQHASRGHGDRRDEARHHEGSRPGSHGYQL